MKRQLPDGGSATPKVTELVVAHGSIVEEFVQAGRLPAKQIGNFYGRHSDRRQAILVAMEAGESYSKAYKASRDCFDTKRWDKVGNRAAACRGLLLKTTALVAQRLPVQWRPDDVERVRAIALALCAEAKALLREVVQVEMIDTTRTPSPTPSREIPRSPITCDKVVSRLSTAVTKLKKNTRDVPQMTEKLGAGPTVTDVAQIAVEAGRIINGVPILIAALEADQLSANSRCCQRDLWGTGLEYAKWLNRVPCPEHASARIATHKKPDADALVSTWFTDRFLFPDRACRVDFVPRDFGPQDDATYDAVLDVGRMCDPSRLVFDHKPPAFEHRDEHCATSLVWHHARSVGCQAAELRELVELVHDGDAATRRQRSSAYARSRIRGLHALIKSARAYAQGDQMLYQGIAAYLDARFRG
jgi:hypothetical protein